MCVSGFRGAFISVPKGFWGADTQLKASVYLCFRKVNLKLLGHAVTQRWIYFGT